MGVGKPTVQPRSARNSLNSGISTTQKPMLARVRKRVREARAFGATAAPSILVRVNCPKVFRFFGVGIDIEEEDEIDSHVAELEAASLLES